MKKSCPACQGFPTKRCETTRPPELSRPPRRVCKPNINGWSILQRKKLKATSSRVTRGQGCLGHPRPYKWGFINVSFHIAKFHIFVTSSCDGKLCFEGFLLRLQDKLDILKQSYTAQRKLHKFLNIWGNLLYISLRLVLFFLLSLIVLAFS